MIANAFITCICPHRLCLSFTCRCVSGLAAVRCHPKWRRRPSLPRALRASAARPLPTRGRLSGPPRPPRPPPPPPPPRGGGPRPPRTWSFGSLHERLRVTLQNGSLPVLASSPCLDSASAARLLHALSPIEKLT